MHLDKEENMDKKIILPLPTEELFLKKEKMWRVKLPEDYKQFIQQSNGLIPQKRYFNFKNNEKVIERFLAILTISGDRIVEDYDIGVVTTQLDGRIVYDEDYVGLHLIPIAALFGGDFICLNYFNQKSYPTICIWSSEESDEFQPTTEFLANNFTEFLEMLHE